MEVRGVGGFMKVIMEHPESLEKAGVTGDQIQQLETVYYDHQQAMISLRAQEERAELEVRKLQTDTTTTKSELMVAIDAVGKAKTSAQKETAGFQWDVKQILGENTLKTLREQFHQKMQKRRQTDGEADQPGFKGRKQASCRDHDPAW